MNLTVARNLFVDSVNDESDAVHSRLTSIRQFDVASVTVIGEGLNLAPVGRVTTFTIQSRDMEANDVNVKITGQRSVFRVFSIVNYKYSCFTVAFLGVNTTL